MPSIGIRSLIPIDTSLEDNVLLFTTLGLALVSFFASTYTTLRTLLPLLPAHPLTRRITGSAVGSYDAPPQAPIEKRARLTSAQRFTVWLTAVDIVAACVLVWEAAFAAMGRNGLGGTKGGASRLYLSCAARPTLLLVVATLSFANVVQGRSIALGTLDWIVWLPALSILALGAGLASLGRIGGAGVWVGLLVWSSVVSAIVTLCFGRLLVAILRVRKATQHQVYNSSWGREQECMTEHGTPYKLSPSFLPPLHSNFSGLSTSFIGTVGRSTSTLDLSTAREILPYASFDAPAVGYAPSRPSVDEDRDFRSPTPGSSHGLLVHHNRSHVASSVSAYSSQTLRANRRSSTPDHHAISFEDFPRPSFGSYASASSYSHAPGFVGGPAVRQAIAKEVWGDTPPPGSGRPKVELSQRAARGAVIRIGGHLAGCLLGYAFLCPFLFIRLTKPEFPPPTFASILLAVAVCQPGVVLAIQCALSEGFWYRTSTLPVLTSSSAATLERIETGEMRERPDSRASSFRFDTRRDPIPGIPPMSLDCDDTRKGRMGRAMSTLAAHPKLLILPTNTDSVTSGFSSPTTPGHARLRSLTLSKSTITSLGPFRQRSESTASRTTVAGFEHSHSTPPAVHRHSDLSDELLTRSLLASRKASWNGFRRVPFGFGSRSTDDLPDKKHTPSPSPTTPTAPAEFGFNTREFSLSPAPPPRQSTGRTDYSIDFLSSQLLPRLVPSVKVGRNTPVDAKDAPLHRRRSSAGTTFEAKTTSSLGRGFAPNRRSRNHRNLSLPGILQSSTWVPFGKGEQEDSEAWIEVGTKDEGPSSELASMTKVVRGHKLDKYLWRRSWKDRMAKAWDRVEEEEATSGGSTSMDDNVYRRQQAQTDKAFATVLRLALPEDQEEESEILDDVRDFADESSGDESAEEFEDYRTAKRSVSPAVESFSPVVATIFQPSTTRVRPAESVVLRGSQVPFEDVELGVVQCATIRPVSRVSTSPSLSSTSGFSLRPTHTQSGSVSSSHSRVSSAGSITSLGFLNLLATQGATWHAREDAALSSADEVSNAEHSPPRRNSAVRPLALLNQRDPNLGTDSSASEKEDDAAKKGKSKSKPAKGPATRATSFNIPPPPIPTIEEDIDGEDKRSGTPTPRASRHRPSPATADEVRTSMQQYLPNLDGPDSFPMSSTPPASQSTTPPAPFITTRSRARQHQLDGVRRSSRNLGAGGDENAAPVASSHRASAASGRSAKTLR